MLAIVVDSTAALTRGEATRLGVTIVSDSYVVDGVSRVETYMNENGAYAAELEAGRITDTRTATVQAFQCAFESLMMSGYDILCTTISSRLAGTYRNACTAADNAIKSGLPCEKPGYVPQIAVLDSLSGFCGTEYLARRARELEMQGLAFDKIIDDLVQARTRQGICFSVIDIDQLRARGRLTMVPQSVSTTLNRYPLFTMQDGAISYAGCARGISTLAHKMTSAVPEDAQDITLAHYGARGPLIVELLKQVKERFPGAKIRVKDGGPVLSSNLGSGAASVSWAPGDLPEDSADADGLA